MFKQSIILIGALNNRLQDY